jgi:diguanylate cyclase (GGDEF)-like protein
LFVLVVLRMSGLVAQVRDQATQLTALAHNDGLTGIPNRRAWDLELVRAMARARRDGHALNIGLLDLDYFKRYNDQHGHQAGDLQLKTAAAAWRARLREGDLLARYGGEEFAVLLPGLTLPEAATVLDRLRLATPSGQTVSIGLAQWDATETPESLFSRADAALYEAKRGGRNRVAADPPLSQPASPEPPARDPRRAVDTLG